jgi:polar amino acid transport system substrate-binding protein
VPNSASGGAEPAHGPKTIYVAVGLVPPNEEKNRSGREAEIIATALEMGDSKFLTDGKPITHERIRFIVEPFAQHWYSYETETRIDAVATVPDSVELKGYKSEYYITYRNVIGMLPSRAALGNDLTSLRGARVVSFPGALRIIPQLKALPQDYFGLFIERENQLDHSEMLMRGQVDAIIADAMIMAYLDRKVIADRTVKKKTLPVFTDIFAPTCYRMVFRDARYKQVFDSGLKKMIENGMLKEIDDRYLDLSNPGGAIHYLAAKGEQPCVS